LLLLRCCNRKYVLKITDVTVNICTKKSLLLQENSIKFIQRKSYLALKLISLIRSSHFWHQTREKLHFMKIFFTLITILLAFIIPSFIDAQVNKQDSLALVDLYNSTGGLHWKNNTNWLTVNPVNKWYGITVEKNRVVEINLYFNQLNGSISPALGNLIQLRSLAFTEQSVKQYSTWIRKSYTTSEFSFIWRSINGQHSLLFR